MRHAVIRVINVVDKISNHCVDDIFDLLGEFIGLLHGVCLGIYADNRLSI